MEKTEAEAEEQPIQEDNYAKTVQTYELDKLDLQEHEWGQVGTYITCRLPGHAHGSYIGPLKQLTRKDGKYSIEDVVPLD